MPVSLIPNFFKRHASRIEAATNCFMLEMRSVLLYTASHWLVIRAQKSEERPLRKLLSGTAVAASPAKLDTCEIPSPMWIAPNHCRRGGTRNPI